MDDKTLRVKAEELYWLSLACTTCRSETAFDGRVERDPAELIICPNCGMPLVNANPVLASYGKYFAELQASGLPAYFVVTVND